MALNLLAGTSGYSYKEWKGPFYPADLPTAKMLSFYAQKFSTVEINNTFYRMPAATTLQKWAAQVPQGFTFALKAPQQITHIKRLKQVDDVVAHFCKVSETLAKHRGPILFQLPPFLKKDLPRLKEFLAALPKNIHAAFEFRHPSWFADDVYNTLRTHHAALCVVDNDDTQESSAREVTANWGYIRLRRTDYNLAKLQVWNAWIREQAWNDVYVFLKHEDLGHGPAWALELMDCWRG